MQFIKMKIALIEPFYGGSHKQWCDGLISQLDAEVDLYSLPARFWKWRMIASSMQLSKDFLSTDKSYELIIGSSLLDFGHFLSMTKNKIGSAKTVYYFHENQFSYPWSENDIDSKNDRNLNFALINFKSALASDLVLFNSHFHRDSFYASAKAELKKIRDDNCLWALEEILHKSKVLPLGLDLIKFNQYKLEKVKNTLVWNHRWEHDKGPEELLQVMKLLKSNSIPMKYHIIGETFKNTLPIFDQIYSEFKDDIISFGYLESFEDYAKCLWSSEYSLSTAKHDFFGISVIEAIHCNCKPILPNRLAYPEHFTSDYPVYENIKDIPKILKTESEINIKDYQWENLKDLYHLTFSDLILKN